MDQAGLDLTEFCLPTMKDCITMPHGLKGFRNHLKEEYSSAGFHRRLITMLLGKIRKEEWELTSLTAE